MSSRAGRSELPARELARQIRALPAPRYEIAVFDGRMTRRLWRGRQALRSTVWLADRNRRGGHVYLRPVTTACVLLDGLAADALAGIRADGLSPAAVLETAPGVFEAWLRLGRELDRKVAACVPQVLRARYGDGPGAADVARLGRAAGFFNRTAALRGSDGRYPRVLLSDARGRVTPRADELVAAAEERLCRRAAERAARRRSEGRRGQRVGAGPEGGARAGDRADREAARGGDGLEPRVRGGGRPAGAGRLRTGGGGGGARGLPAGARP